MEGFLFVMSGIHDNVASTQMFRTNKSKERSQIVVDTLCPEENNSTHVPNLAHRCHQRLECTLPDVEVPDIRERARVPIGTDRYALRRPPASLIWNPACQEALLVNVRTVMLYFGKAFGNVFTMKAFESIFSVSDTRTWFPEKYVPYETLELE